MNSQVIDYPSVKVVVAPIVMAASPNSLAAVASSHRAHVRIESTEHTSSDRSDLLVSTIPANGDDRAVASSSPRDSVTSSVGTSSSPGRRKSSSTTRGASWAIRMVHFVQNVRRRLSHAKKSDAGGPSSSLSDSPKSRRTPFNNGRKLTSADGSPSLPSLTVTLVDDQQHGSSSAATGRKDKRDQPQQRSPSAWSLRVEAAFKVGGDRCRKLSAGSCDGRLKSEKVDRKLTAPPPRLSANDLSKSGDIASRLTEYVVNVKTSDRFGAGTDAKVYLEMYGESDERSETFALQHSNNVNKFERNQLDRFVLRASSVGRIQSIKIWHDNAGVGAAWHLAYVEVCDTTLGLLFRFPCHGWLSETDSFGVTRELKCFEVLEGQKKARQIASGVSKQFRSDSLSALNVSSAPTTPFMSSKKRPPPSALTIPSNTGLVISTETVFTPAPTRPPTVIRLPLGLGDEDGVLETPPSPYRHANTHAAFSSHTLAQALNVKMSMDAKVASRANGRKRTVYGSIPTANHNGLASEKTSSVRASIDSLSSSSDFESASSPVIVT